VTGGLLLGKIQSGFLLFTDPRSLGELGQARDIYAITPPIVVEAADCC
jgi:hypothetical protein